MKLLINIWWHLDFRWLKVHAEELREQTRWGWIIQPPNGPSLRIFEWEGKWKCTMLHIVYLHNYMHRSYSCESRQSWISQQSKDLSCTINWDDPELFKDQKSLKILHFHVSGHFCLEVLFSVKGNLFFENPFLRKLTHSLRSNVIGFLSFTEKWQRAENLWLCISNPFLNLVHSWDHQIIDANV